MWDESHTWLREECSHLPEVRGMNPVANCLALPAVDLRRLERPNLLLAKELLYQLSYRPVCPVSAPAGRGVCEGGTPDAEAFASTLLANTEPPVRVELTTLRLQVGCSGH